jgi:hypothetical protein
LFVCLCCCLFICLVMTTCLIPIKALFWNKLAFLPLAMQDSLQMMRHYHVFHSPSLSVSSYLLSLSLSFSLSSLKLFIFFFLSFPLFITLSFPLLVSFFPSCLYFSSAPFLGCSILYLFFLFLIFFFFICVIISYYVLVISYND